MKSFSLQNMENAEYIRELYDSWKTDPDSVDRQWHYFFIGFENGLEERPAVGVPLDIADKQTQVDSLIYAYRDIGYLAADLDPLQQTLECHHELSLGEFELTEEDLEKQFSCGHFPGLDCPTLREIIDTLSETYCRTIGVEYLHIQDKMIRRWLQRKIEPNRNHPQLGNDKKVLILQKLIESEEFEKFLHTQYIGQKRFSLEGAETTIPLLHAIIEKAPDWNIEEIVIGMSHRGRLNVLANILDKSILEIFGEFEDNFIPETFGGDGDVKYHKGYSTRHMNHLGKSCYVSLASNPSHLEMVGPVVQGKTRAKQRIYNDTEDRQKVLPVVLHGDAAFSGQGIVAETFNLSQLKGYRTGGTIHVIINNQIGFTTTPQDSRSSCFPTDIAKMLQIPIFHVNADDPEAAVYIAELALEFRQMFGRDVVIDLFCYRKHGHNEGDEPSFTQPRLYELIDKHPGTRTVYSEQLLNVGIVDKAFIESMQNDIQEYFKKAFNLVKNASPKAQLTAYNGLWRDLGDRSSASPIVTGVERETLLMIAEKISTPPEKFSMHRKLVNIIKRRYKRLQEKNELDWSFAEALAFGSLLHEGTPLRLSGQDSGRGTFSQRHSVWWDTKNSKEYKPFNTISPDQARFCVYDSPLSEVAVLAFEYGYSLVEPRMLIMWEAQFGDFSNGAQVIIDQFIVSSESKWNRSSGLVLLLPHGYEGQGPEHSTGHLERFLQLCAENNMQVCNATTPAQYFHLLRRQIHRNFRKPLIIMTPKSLLRHPLVVSSLDDLTSGYFHDVLDDSPENKGPTEKLVFCTGKIFWDLYSYREEKNRYDTRLVRIEQLYPFPHRQLAQILKSNSAVSSINWVQEEPQNRGAWTYIAQQFTEHFPDLKLQYIGREASASPATGSLKQHKMEQEKIVKTVFGEGKQ